MLEDEQLATMQKFLTTGLAVLTTRTIDAELAVTPAYRGQAESLEDPSTRVDKHSRQENWSGTILGPSSPQWLISQRRSFLEGHIYQALSVKPFYDFLFGPEEEYE
jgi:hypothetical protein